MSDAAFTKILSTIQNGFRLLEGDANSHILKDARMVSHYRSHPQGLYPDIALGLRITYPSLTANTLMSERNRWVAMNEIRFSTKGIIGSSPTGRITGIGRAGSTDSREFGKLQKVKKKQYRETILIEHLHRIINW